MELNINAVPNSQKLESKRRFSLNEQQLVRKTIKDDQILIPLWSIIIFLATSLGCALAIELLSIDRNLFFQAIHFRSLFQCQQEPNLSNTSATDSVTFAIYENSTTEEHLRHIINVLARFGYQRTPVNSSWDLLWAHDYPFLRMTERLKNLGYHQQVNHIPGCGFITNKVALSITPLPFLPKSFRLPDQQAEFLRYAELHHEALFVVKDNEHRNIEMKLPHEINLNSTGFFVQQYIENPLLVDGYKFDIGVYVIITSVDPLRMYIYTGDVLFRYCAVKYYPFDPKNTEKYVVGDDYLPTWEVPSLAEYYKRHSGSMRGAFDAYMRDQLMEPLSIWKQIDEIVRSTVLAKENDIARILSSYKTRNFFELLRFDMIIDERLDVYLLEVNMSPNLSSAHFQPNAVLYEQILYSVFNLLGIGSTVRRTSLRDGTDEIEEMITAEKNLATNINICAECNNQCNLDACQLCLSCVSGSQFEILKKAHREHLHCTDMRRLFPKAILNPESYDIEAEVENLSKRNAWMTRWYFGKCLYDRKWCL